MKPFLGLIALLVTATTALAFGPPNVSSELRMHDVYWKRDSARATTEAITLYQAPAEPKYSQEYFYDFKAKRSSLVVSTDVGKLTNFLGTGKSADVIAFAGVDVNPLTGFAIVGRGKLADELSYFGGVGGIFRQGEAPQIGGLIFGFSYSPKPKS